MESAEFEIGAKLGMTEYLISLFQFLKINFNSASKLAATTTATFNAIRPHYH
jgi:predicted HTH domain antitoxin